MKNKHNLISKALLILLLTVSSLADAQQWQELDTGVSECLYGIYCIDTNTVFTCGHNGVIMKTEDGGNSWQEKYRQDGYDWYSIKFLNSRIGYVLGISDEYGNNEILLKTVDGGETWQDMGNPFNEYNYSCPTSCDIFIVDADTLYVACDQLMKSTDGGNSFSRLDLEWIDTTQDLYFEDSIGYIVWGVPGEFIGTHVARTTDYGSTWEEIVTFDAFDEYSVYGIEQAVFHDKEHVSLYGGFVDEDSFEYNEIRTEDGFATNQWLLNETVPIGHWTAFPPIAGMCFSDNQNGIVVFLWHDFSPNSAFCTFQTQDGGNTWFELGTISCAYSNYAAISGCEGVYYLAIQKGNVYKMKMTPEGILEKKEEPNAFPNPVSNTFFVVGRQNCELVLYDISGRVMLRQKICDEKQRVELGDLPLGVFILCIKDIEGNSTFKKIIKQ